MYLSNSSKNSKAGLKK